MRADFGRDVAHGEWYPSSRLGLRTDLDLHLVRVWAPVPAAVGERAVRDDPLDGASPPTGLWLERDFCRRPWVAAHRARGTPVIYTSSPGKAGAHPARRRPGPCPLPRWLGLDLGRPRTT